MNSDMKRRAFLRTATGLGATIGILGNSESAFGETATLTREEGGIVHDPRFVFGARVWY